jgi:hypothetical protein
VEFESNTPEIPRIADANWGHWQHRFNTPPISIRCIVAEGASQAAPPTPTLRVQRHLLTITADNENFGVCDLESGFAFAWITPAVLADEDYFRQLFLECMVYCILENLHLFSIHAACVTRNGRGVLLAGESGAGKSSLAYACARRGWTYVSDDRSALIRCLNERTVLGDPRHFRFRESAGDLFPEFRGIAASSRRPGNGKPTVEIRTEMLPGIQTASESPVDHIVFLDRSSDPRVKGGLRHFNDHREAQRRLHHDIWPRELDSQDSKLAALRRLLGLPMFDLSYCRVDDAVDALDHLVDKDPR